MGLEGFGLSGLAVTLGGTGDVSQQPADGERVPTRADDGAR
jgi:hypothetical protein